MLRLLAAHVACASNRSVLSVSLCAGSGTPPALCSIMWAASWMWLALRYVCGVGAGTLTAGAATRLMPHTAGSPLPTLQCQSVIASATPFS